jgi:hypothetical protein
MLDIQKTAARTGDSSFFLVASYNRQVCEAYLQGLGQTGTGHFCPIGGYHANTDRVLLLDTARFKYPPHWAALTSLYSAMRDIDPATDKSRGWVTLRPRSRVAPRYVQLQLNESVADRIQGFAQWLQEHPFEQHPAAVAERFTELQLASSMVKLTPEAASVLRLQRIQDDLVRSQVYQALKLLPARPQFDIEKCAVLIVAILHASGSPIPLGHHLLHEVGDFFDQSVRLRQFFSHPTSACSH